MTDVHELEKGMEISKKEYQTRKERDAPIVLRDFLGSSEEKLKKLITDVKTAKVWMRFLLIMSHLRFLQQMSFIFLNNFVNIIMKVVNRKNW